MHDRTWLWLALGVCTTLTAATACTTDEPGGGSSDGIELPPSVELRAEKQRLAPGESANVSARVAPSAGADLSDAGASDALEGLEIEWSVTNEEWSLEPSGASATVTAPESYGTAVSVRVRVTNDSGAGDIDDIYLQTVQNRPPRLVNLSATPNVIEPGGKLTLEAEAEDPDGDDVSYSWSAPENWTLESNSERRVTLVAPESQGEIARVAVDISDGAGGTIQRGLQVRTTRNSSPSISAMTASPPQVAPGGKTDISVDATDPDGDSLSYDWSAPMDWSVSASSAVVQVTAPDAYGASAKISVEISDDSGASVTGRVVVSTSTNGGPNISSLTANPQRLQRGGTSSLTVSADDPNGDTLSFSWSVSETGWSVTGNGPTATVDAPDKPGSSTSVQVEVADSDGKKAIASIVVSTRPNHSPSMSSITANPTNLPAGGTSQLNVTASDPDGDKLSYSWSTPQGWSVSSQVADPTLQAPSKRGETAVLSVTVDDGRGGTTSGSIAVATTANRAPTISNVTAKPILIPKGGTSTLTASATDPDGDKLSYSWTIPSGWTQSGSGSQIDVQAPDKYGETASFDVTVSDGNGASTTGSTTAQTEPNGEPLIASLTADQTTLSPGGSTKVHVEAVDPNNDSLSYSWSVPSGWSKSGSGDTITVTAPNTSGASGKIQVTVSDGTDSVSDSITLTTS